MVKSSLKIKKYHEIPEWDRFVLEHPQGSVFHTTSMIRCDELTPNRVPFAYGAIDSEGRLCALLVAVRVSTLNVAAGQIASRSIMEAEPIFNRTESGRKGIVDLLEHHDQQMSRKVLFSEIRPFHQPADHAQFSEGNLLTTAGYSQLGYINYEMELSSCEDELFRRLGSKRRNNVRSANRRGVHVREVSGQSGRDQLYAMLSHSYSRVKIPLVDRSLFESAAEQLPEEYFRIYTAYYQGDPVASGCFLAFKDRIICWYVGSLRLKGIAATTSVFWHAMKTFGSEGYRIFDFAGGGWQNEHYGPGRFKAQFGGTVTNHGRYRKIYAPWKLRVAQTIYDRFRVYLAPKSCQTPFRIYPKNP
jgi:serine/alanine adding enzyme